MTCYSIDWSAIDVIVNILDTLIIIIPAVITFIYYKLHILDITLISKTESGIKICLHNISKNTIFILNASLKIKGTMNTIDILNYFNEENSNKLLSIPPDSAINLTLDYTVMNISPISRATVIIYNGKQKIKKKIK